MTMKLSNDKFNVEPIEGLGKWKWTYFLTKRFPTSCESCPDRWNDHCGITTHIKECAMLNGCRPASCPLVEAEFYGDEVTRISIQVLPESVLNRKNPLFNVGAIICSKIDNEYRIKIGTGDKFYNDLPFEKNAEINTDNNEETVENEKLQ